MVSFKRVCLKAIRITGKCPLVHHDCAFVLSSLERILSALFDYGFIFPQLLDVWLQERNRKFVRMQGYNSIKCCHQTSVP
jgi:hypothetical protein